MGSFWIGALVQTGALLRIGALLLVGALAPSGVAQTPQPGFQGPGSLLICGGGKLPKQVLDAFWREAGGANARLVVISTASGYADDADAESRFLGPWRKDQPQARITLLHTRDRGTADQAEFAAPLRDATAVWISGGDQRRLWAAYGGTRVEREILKVVARGGVVAGTSAGAAIQSRAMITGGKGRRVELGQGFDLLPGAVVDQHFGERKRRSRLEAALAKHEDRFGLGVDEGTGAWIHLRSGKPWVQVVGRGEVTLLRRDPTNTLRCVRLQSGDRAVL